MPRKTKDQNDEKIVKKDEKDSKTLKEIINEAHLKGYELKRKINKDIKNKIEEINQKDTKTRSNKKSDTKKSTDKKTNSSKSASKAVKTTTKSSVSNTKNKSDDKDKSRAKTKAPKSVTSKNKKTKAPKAPKGQKETPQIVEYYDLPYRYNQTIVKLLYQTPTTLFVYWDISDDDRENYKRIYGENFFGTTRPVLIFHNITKNYSTEIDINDFANSWYIHINDSNCDYIVELGRRPNYYSQVKDEYIYISSSNEMIAPNDKILFNVDILDTLYFKNVKNGNDIYIKLSDLFKNEHYKDFPLINFHNIHELYKAIYGNENLENLYNINNPSSR